MNDPLLLITARVVTYSQSNMMTNASGFFFDRDGQLFFVSSRHVFIDEPTNHRPDEIGIEIHTDSGNLTAACLHTVKLYDDSGTPLWRETSDAGGLVDVAAIAIDRASLPATAVFGAFTPELIAQPQVSVDLSTSLLVVGFPLGFHDTLHHLPVIRQASLASAFGLRFQGHGYFLTDARTHRGISGAPVVMRQVGDAANSPLPWLLLGVHSSRLDAAGRDSLYDEVLGLNCTWYADVLLQLTEPPPPQQPPAPAEVQTSETLAPENAQEIMNETAAEAISNAPGVAPVSTGGVASNNAPINAPVATSNNVADTVQTA
jgi:hypothetical protein